MRQNNNRSSFIKNTVDFCKKKVDHEIYLGIVQANEKCFFIPAFTYFWNPGRKIGQKID